MSDRLTDTDDGNFLVFSDNRIDFFVYSVFIFGGDFWKQSDFYFSVIGSLSMSICISSSKNCPCSSYTLDFYKFLTKFLCYTDRIVERTSWFCCDRDRITRFIERWESLLSCHYVSKDCKWNRDKCNEKGKFGIPETPEDWFFCKSFESMSEPSILFDMPMLSLDPRWEEIAADHRDKSHSSQKRHDHRDHICYTDRCEDLPIDAWEHEKWDKYDELEDRRIDDTSSHFFRGFIDHLEWVDMLFFREESIETKSSENILHIDDRIIHEFSDSDGESSEYHDIDTDSEDIKHYPCQDECNRK